MFSFIRKKSLVKRAALMGAVLVLLAGLLFVSCADPVGGITDDAQQPSITTQPQDGIWDTSADVTFALTVTASVTDGGTLSYQWYSNAANSNSGGTAVGSNSATLTLDSKDYTANGDYYFYVIVTNTNNNATGTKTAAAASNVATITVDGIDGVYNNAQKPVIETQPANTFWNVFTAKDGVKLTVEATVEDGGTLSYQWYSKTSASDVDGTKIDTATDKDYLLTKTDCTANGTYYFYVIVTNTNNNVSGTKTFSATSDTATVTVVGYPDTSYSDTYTLPSNLIGNWESEYGEIFTISATEFSSGADWGDGWSGYKGTIENHRGNAEGTAGYITIKLTECSWDDSAANKYYVVYYEDLSDVTVTISGAGSFTFTDPDFGISGGRSTKDEAEATYTVSAGYFAMGSDLTKEGEGGVPIAHAEVPTISSQPASESWNVTTVDNFSLTVTASVTDGGTLSYQWYSNTANSTSGGTPVGTDNSTLTLAKTSYDTDGSYHFYVVVTNTNNSVNGTKSVTKTSNVATVTVTGNSSSPPVNAEVPTITSQPAATTNWNVSTDTTKTITVTANVTDGGALSYQWYKNTSNSNTGGTAVGSNSAILSLAKADYATNGSYYFYVVVTNTNNSVTGTKTAVVTSSVATVTVTGNTFVLDPNYVGYWRANNTYDGFVFSASPPSVYNTFFTYDGGDITDSDGIFYTGTIHDIIYFNTDEGIIYVEFTERAEWFASSGSGNFTAIYLKIFREDSMGIYLIADPDGVGANTPFYETLEEAKEAVNPNNIRDCIYDWVTDGLEYIKQ